MTDKVNQGAAVPVEDADDFEKAFSEAIEGIKPATQTSTPVQTAVSGAVDDAAKKAAAETATKAADDAAKVAADAAAKAVADAAKVVADDAAAKAAAATKTPEEIAKEAAASEAAQKAAEAERKAAEAAATKTEADQQAAAEAARKEREAKRFKLSADQEAKIKKAKEDWPDVFEASELQHKAALAEQEEKFTTLIEGLFGKFSEYLNPYLSSQQDILVREHFGAIRTAHKDYDQVYPKLKGWIDTQPAYLAETFNRVYNEGTAEEIIDLVTRYKAATGSSATPKPEGQSTEAGKEKSAEVDPKKVAALAPVDSQRPRVEPKGTDPNNFDDAFDEAASKIGK